MKYEPKKNSTNTWTKERNKEYQREWSAIRRKERSAYLRAYKMEQGCDICGYKGSPAALDFHHRDPSEKKFTISNNLSSRNWDSILAEINKCDILCANCHRIEHDKGGD